MTNPIRYMSDVSPDFLNELLGFGAVGKVTPVVAQKSALMESPVRLTISGRVLPEPERVIFNPPATIVYWSDGDKTVVQCYNDEFSEEFGYAMACMRKLYGNRKTFKACFADAQRTTQNKDKKEKKQKRAQSADPIYTFVGHKKDDGNFEIDKLMRDFAGDNSMRVATAFRVTEDG